MPSLAASSAPGSGGSPAAVAIRSAASSAARAWVTRIPAPAVVSAAAAPAAAAPSGAASGGGSGGGTGRRGWDAPRLRSVACALTIIGSSSRPYAAARSTAGPPRRPIHASSAASNASAASRRWAASSRTPNRGSSPAASGRLRRTRAQNPWIVPIQAASVARACSISPSSTNRRRIRSRSSAAAFSVKVSVRIAPTATPSRRTASANRSTITAVLPEPAPAASSDEPSPVGDRRALLGRAPHAGGSLRGSPARQIAGYRQPRFEQRSGHGRIRPACSSAAVRAARSRTASSASSKPAASTVSVRT